MGNLPPPRVAIVGAGEHGLGWAALVAAHGWPLTIFDTDAGPSAAAPAAVAKRVEALVEGARADRATAANGVYGMKIGRSLLQAVGEADWIIDASVEEWSAKQRLLEQIEQVSRVYAITTSAARDLDPGTLAARSQRLDRLLALRVRDPVELIPVVEVVPGPGTDPDRTDDVLGWLHALGRMPVVVHKPQIGSLVDRLAAAVWRECAQLVLDGIVDVRDADRLVSRGAALLWQAAGPHLATVTDSASTIDPAEAVALAQQRLEAQCASLATWTALAPEDRQRLARAVAKAYAEPTAQLRTTREKRLSRAVMRDGGAS